jgi:hypothetical protein
MTVRPAFKFSKKDRVEFLSCFSGTANAEVAAERVGANLAMAVTVRAEDPSFAEAWDASVAESRAALTSRLATEAESCHSDECEKLKAAGASLLEAIAQPGGEDIDFEPSRLGQISRVVDLT